ncbi:MAG TPA: diphthine--ammonia ligase [Bacillales bacterium]|jgi:uncharacterized protein (TIGR00290 family)|nr:diphthine--ammonia ligase [Bacillales bacterium]
MRKKTAVSWSGGKDSCFALHSLLEQGFEISALISMVSGEHRRNHVHGIPFEPLKLQAAALGLPIRLVESFGDHEESFKKGLLRLKKDFDVEAVAFGTLYVEADRRWNEKMAAAAGLEPLFPLWGPKARAGELLREWIALGYRSTVCRASEKDFDRTWAGRSLDSSFVESVQQLNVCPMGESGEYHTFVTDGPIFTKCVEIEKAETVLNSGLWSLDIQKCRLIKKDS